MSLHNQPTLQGRHSACRQWHSRKPGHPAQLRTYRSATGTSQGWAAPRDRRSTSMPAVCRERAAASRSTSAASDRLHASSTATHRHTSGLSSSPNLSKGRRSRSSTPPSSIGGTKGCRLPRDRRIQAQSSHEPWLCFHRGLRKTSSKVQPRMRHRHTRRRAAGWWHTEPGRGGLGQDAPSPS